MFSFPYRCYIPNLEAAEGDKNVPKFTTDKQVAKHDDGRKWLARVT